MVVGEGLSGLLVGECFFVPGAPDFGEKAQSVEPKFGVVGMVDVAALGQLLRAELSDGVWVGEHDACAFKACREVLHRSAARAAAFVDQVVETSAPLVAPANGYALGGLRDDEAEQARVAEAVPSSRVEPSFGVQ